MQTSQELTSLPSYELLHKLEELRHAAAEIGYQWAEADKSYKDAKELLPCVLAEYTRHYSTVGVKSTEARVKALADKMYQEKVKEMNQLEYAARLKEVEYKGLMKSIEALTSIAYVRNNELKLAR